ncbi:MAG: ABC transporter permease [Candidatus Bipolaricaulota bacterium]|nr:ABC transporter permease [Candidatus Bipolaricaulota bacterium]
MSRKDMNTVGIGGKGLNMLKRIEMDKYGPFLALLVLFVVSAFASPYFLRLRNLTNILRQVSYTGIIGLGMTFVIISGGIDLSVGSMLALVGGIGIILLNYLGGGVGAIIAVFFGAVVVGSAAGAINGFAITKGRVAPFIVTLGTMSIFRSLTLFISNAGEFRSHSSLYPSLGMGYFLGLPNPVWIFLLLTALFHVVLYHTRFGRYVCAVGSNERVAVYAAIKSTWIKFYAYVIVGATVGISAVLLSSRLNSISSTNAGAGYELDAIAAVIIGGTSLSGGSGSIIGPMIGALILGIVNNMLNMLGVSPYLQGTVKGIVIIGAVLIQRKGRRLL